MAILLFIALFLIADLAAAEEIRWPAYGGGPGGGHYTPATQITADNVADLELAWSHRSGDFYAGSQSLTELTSSETSGGRPSSFIVTPIMVEGTVFYCTPFNRVFALDPATGEEKWAFDPKVDMEDEGLTNCRGVSYWHDKESEQSVCKSRIILGTLDSRLIAVDAQDRRTLPTVRQRR